MLKAWIDSEIQVLLGMQKNSGIIEGCHGNGNFARTALMYGLWKTQGAHLDPWQPTVKIGAISAKEKIYFVITAEDDWEGPLMFDQKRHKTILNLPVDYSRINQFPEWFKLEYDAMYSIESNQKQLNGRYEGKDLKLGIKISLSAKEQCVIIVKKPRI